jgi:NitT/TauT family transport system substrate-binding protein
MSYSLRFRGVAAMGLIALGLAVSGCPSSNKNGGEGAGPSAAGPTTVRLAFFPNITHAAALVGTGNGSFQKALGDGVKIEEQSFNAGPAEIEALFAGQVDIGYIGPGPALNGFLKSRGKALRIIAGASSGGAALVVRSDSGISDVAGLAGKRVAVPQTGGTQDISLRHAMQAAGLSSTDKGGTVNVLPTANADALTLFVKKELDAAWVPEPWVTRLVKEGNGRVLVDERTLWPQNQFSTTVVIVRTEFLKDHPDVARKLLAAHVETIDWINANKDEARRIIGERIKALTKKPIPDDVLTEAMGRTDFTFDPLRQSVLTFADWAKALGYQREGPDALADLVDLKLLNEVLSAAKKPAIP